MTSRHGNAFRIIDILWGNMIRSKRTASYMNYHVTRKTSTVCITSPWIAFHCHDVIIGNSHAICGLINRKIIANIVVYICNSAHGMRSNRWNEKTDIVYWVILWITLTCPCMQHVCACICMVTSLNGNIFRVTGLLLGESSGHWRIPLTKTSDAEHWFFICAWTNGWANNRDAGDLRHHRAHYDVTVICGLERLV